MRGFLVLRCSRQRALPDLIARALPRCRSQGQEGVTGSFTWGAREELFHDGQSPVKFCTSSTPLCSLGF